MKKAIFILFLMISSCLCFAQRHERYGLNDLMDMILEDAVRNRNQRLNLNTALNTPRAHDSIIKGVLGRNPDWINTRLSWYSADDRLVETGLTLLNTAAQSNNVHMMKYLIDNGADLNLEGQTHPLITAAAGNASLAVEYLIKEYHVDVNMRDNSTLTPLMLAIQFFPGSYYDNSPEKNVVGAFSVLLDSPDLQINLTDNRGRNAATYALEDIIKTKPESEQDFFYRESALMFKKILQHGGRRDATVNPTDSNVIKILQANKIITLINEDPEFKMLFFRYLFDIDIDDPKITQENLDNDFIASLSKPPEELIDVINRIKNISGVTYTPAPSLPPAQTPTPQHNTEPVRSVLPTIDTVCQPITYDYDESDEFGNMLRLISQSVGRTHLVSQTPEDFASGDLWVHLMSRIRKHPEYLTMTRDNKTILTAAGSAGNVGIINLLNRISGMPTDESGNVLHPVINQGGAISPLISHAQTGRGYNHTHPAQILLNNGANVNAQHPENDCTALMYSIIYDHTGITLKLLKQNDIDLNLLSSENKTALRYAFDKGCVLLVEGTDRYEDFCQILVDKGAEVDDYLASHPDFQKYRTDVNLVENIVGEMDISKYAEKAAGRIID